ncbi:hypothetical protein J3E69DRAFT_323031 [Trichoderma sp. SZMC 28015]
MVESILQVGSVKGTDAKGTGTGTGGAWTVCFFLEMWAAGAYLGYVILQEKGQRICTQLWKPAILGAFGLFCLCVAVCFFTLQLY